MAKSSLKEEIMNINWIGSPNYVEGRKGCMPLAIIDHVMCGSEEGTDEWFQNPASQVSAHFGVAKDGRIHQYVKEEDTAWANGRMDSPDTEWLENFPNVNPNLWTISIEHEGQPNEPLTTEQEVASIELHRYLCINWNIPVDLEHITGHYRIDSISRKDCPSSTFPFQKIIDSINGESVTMTSITNIEKVMVQAGDRENIQGMNINGVSFVPIKELCKAMGHSIDYDNGVITVK